MFWWLFKDHLQKLLTHLFIELYWHYGFVVAALIRIMSILKLPTLTRIHWHWRRLLNL